MTDAQEPTIDPTLPEVVQNFLRSGATLEEIRLDEQGRWHHQGQRFDNPRLSDLFSRSVNRTEGGTWVLEIGPFTYPITVDDTGFFVRAVNWKASPPMLHLSDRSTEALEPASLEYRAPGKLYCAVKDGRFRARFLRSAYHSIIPHLEQRDSSIVLAIDGQEIHLGDIDSLDA